MSWISLLNLIGLIDPVVPPLTPVGVAGEIGRHILSESSNGEAIDITTHVSPGITVHIVPAGKIDEVWLWINSFGNHTHASFIINGAEIIEQNLSQEEGFISVCPGVRFPGGTVISCISDGLPSDTSIVGHINRIS
jgi:hypothetical protein